MKTTRISRGRKIALLTLSVICICLCGFLIWLSKYSSIYPIGEAKPTGHYHPIWSPDGTYIALYCGFSYPTDGWDERSFDNLYWYLHTKDICIVNLKTRQLKRLTFGRDKWDLIMSPDGKMLSWDDRVEDRMIIYDVIAQKTVAKVKNMVGGGSFWSLDGQRILSSCGNDVFDVKTKKISLHPSMVSFNVELSPNEQYLAFTQQVHPDGTEFEMVEGEPGACPSPDEIDPDEILVIMENGKVKYKSDFIVYGWLVWSPDSSFLTSKRESKEIEADELAIVYVPTGETASLTVKSWMGDWYWSPSGNKIAYKTFDKIAQNDVINVVEFEFKTNPFSYSIISEQTFPLEKRPEYISEDDYLAWSADGRYIAYTLRRLEGIKDFGAYGIAHIYEWEKIWILDLATGEQTPLLPEE